jgi:hypothetical protein
VKIFSEKVEKINDEIPDVEVASISSDDTIPYDVPSDYVKESESKFVSDDRKCENVSGVEEVLSESNLLSENEKLWSQLHKSILKPIKIKPIAQVEIPEMNSDTQKVEEAEPKESSIILDDIKEKLDEKLKKLQEKSIEIEDSDVEITRWGKWNWCSHCIR